MQKLGIQNLSMIVTDRCNINCEHCFRGPKRFTDMSNDVIDATLEQIAYIGNLNVCGGEPTLAMNSIKNLFDNIQKKNIIIDNVNVTINGTIFEETLLYSLNSMSIYISKLSNNTIKRPTTFSVSNDEYHKKELERLGLYKRYLENFKQYRISKHFTGFRYLKSDIKLFNEGNAKKLDDSLTIDLVPYNIYLTYINNVGKFDKRKGFCMIGPMITVNTKGIVTDCNASIENQETIYNYGSVLKEPIEQIALRRGKVLRPNKFNEKCAMEIGRYENYNK